MKNTPIATKNNEFANINCVNFVFVSIVKWNITKVHITESTHQAATKAVVLLFMQKPAFLFLFYFIPKNKCSMPTATSCVR